MISADVRAACLKHCPRRLWPVRARRAQRCPTRLAFRLSFQRACTDEPVAIEPPKPKLDHIGPKQDDTGYPH
jgi:hypothetical protein